MAALTGLSGLSGLSAICGGEWTPAQLPGIYAWYDANRASTLFQDAAASTPATGTDPVGRINSLIAGAPYFSTSTDSRRPTIATYSGSIKGLLFDGSNDALQSSTTNDWKFLNDGTGFTMFVQVKYTGTGEKSILDSCNLSSSNTGIYLTSINTGSNVGFVVARGSSGNLALNGYGTSGTFVNGADTRLSLKYNYSGGTNSRSLRINGTGYADVTSAAFAPSSSNPSFALTLGASASLGSLFSAMTISRLIICTGTTAYDQAALVEAWMQL